MQKAFVEVLKTFSEEEFDLAANNLILMVLHKGALGQVMHFPNTNKQFKIMQLTIPRSMPLEVMKYVIAHEFGHVMQGRNWKKSDGSKLEADADSWAKKPGFFKNSSCEKWMNASRLIKGKYPVKKSTLSG